MLLSAQMNKTEGALMEEELQFTDKKPKKMRKKKKKSYGNESLVSSPSNH